MKNDLLIQELNLVMEASTLELKEINLFDRIQSQELSIYAKVLDSYFCADSEQLIENMKSFDEESELFYISYLRYNLLKQKYEKKIIFKVCDTMNSESVYSAEAALALGRYYLAFDKYQEASDTFKIAHDKLEKMGLKKKALKAYQNLLISKTRVNPNKRYIQDYEFLAKRASELGEKAVESISYHNISRELFFIGAFNVALRYSNLAIKLLDEERGTLHFFEALLHRCHLLIELNLYERAYEDYQYAKTSTHTQTLNALKVIEKLLTESKNKMSLSHIEPCWRVKLARTKKTSFNFTKSESKFIEFIKGEPKSRIEIIDFLYGAEADYEASLNRLRVLLSRLRKKAPALIVEECETFTLIDNIYESA